MTGIFYWVVWLKSLLKLRNIAKACHFGTWHSNGWNFNRHPRRQLKWYSLKHKTILLEYGMFASSSYWWKPKADHAFPLKCVPNKNSTFCLVLRYVIRSMEPLSFRSSLFALENSVGEASGCLQSKYKGSGEETSFENNKIRFSSVE